MRLRALLFDAGNTLIRMDYDAIARRLDDEVLAGAGPGASTESRSTAERYARYVLEGLGVVDAATIEAFVEWRRTYNPPVGLWTAAEPRAARALARARAAGLRAGVISNSNGTVRRILEGLGLIRGLDFVVDSGEVGVEKPDPAIFRLALERAGVAPAEAVYVGDLYSVDVLGARAAGVEAILVDPGRCWGARDCRRAGDVDAAVRLALTGRDYSGSVTNG